MNYPFFLSSALQVSGCLGFSRSEISYPYTPSECQALISWIGDWFYHQLQHLWIHQAVEIWFHFSIGSSLMVYTEPHLYYLTPTILKFRLQVIILFSRTSVFLLAKRLVTFAYARLNWQYMYQRMYSSVFLCKWLSLWFGGLDWSWWIERGNRFCCIYSGFPL